MDDEKAVGAVRRARWHFAVDRAMRPAIAKWVAGATLVMVAAAAVYWFDWNMLRGPLGGWASVVIGHKVEIRGALKVQPSLHPSLSMQDVVVGNAAWSRDPVMAQIGELDCSFDLLGAFRQSWTFHRINLSHVQLILERNRDGDTNWNREWSGGAGVNIASLGVDDGKVVFRDPAAGTELSLRVQAMATAAQGGNSLVGVDGGGRYKGMATKVYGGIGELTGLRDARHPYRVDLDLVVGRTHAKIDGELIDPLNFTSENLNFRIEGNDLADLYPVLGLPLPPTSNYRLSGHLYHTAKLWRFRDFSGSVGSSDLRGVFSADRSVMPQRISADLRSRNLDVRDLGGFIGASRGTRPSPAPPAPGRVLPVETIDPEKLRAATVILDFHADRFVATRLPLEKMATQLHLENGVLRFQPLNFSAAGGEVVANLTMDARGPTIKTHTEFDARRLRMDELTPESSLKLANTGRIGATGKLDSTGNTLADILATANGEVTLAGEGGSMSELTLRLSNLDLARALVVKMTGDRQTPIECLAGRFDAVDGDFKLRSFVLQTPKADIGAGGDVNFRDESLNLILAAHGKGFTPLSLRGPIAVKGSFAKPLAKPEMRSILGSSALALALALPTAGAGALVPLVDFGGRARMEDGNCRQQVADTKPAAPTRHAAAR
jgi:AsmA family protein